MDKIIRCITSDGAVMASAIDASDIVFKAQKIHGLSRSATAALGRLLCATSMMVITYSISPYITAAAVSVTNLCVLFSEIKQSILQRKESRPLVVKYIH